MSGDRRIVPPRGVAGFSPLVEARFVPQRYEPNYAYPLLVMLHGRGGDEQQLIRSMPALSWRNYIGLGLRGPESFLRRDGQPGFGWGPAFTRPGRDTAGRGASPSDAEVFRRSMAGESVDGVERIEDGIFEAVRQARKSLHIHSERIFLVGTGEGAAVAFRLGLTYPERFAGVVAINGWIPRGFRPLARYKDCRQLRVLALHGEWNSRAPIDRIRRDVGSLRAAGLRVAFQSYPFANRITAPMLSDVDTWVIHQCTDGI